MTVSEVLVAMRSHIEHDLHHDLPKWWRIRLWREMTSELGPTASLRIRGIIATSVARIPVLTWTALSVSSEVDQSAIDFWCDIVRTLGGTLAMSTLEAREQRFEDEVQWIADNYWDSCRHAVLGFASAYAASRVVTGLEDTVYDELGWYKIAWGEEIQKVAIDANTGCVVDDDVHFFGSAIASGGAPWEDGGNDFSRHAFWNQWLGEMATTIRDPEGALAVLLQSLNKSG
jgi:hypothetical protein